MAIDGARTKKTGADDSLEGLCASSITNYQLLVPQRLHRLQVRGSIRGIDPEEQTRRRGEEDGEQDCVDTDAGMFKSVLWLLDKLVKYNKERL